MTPLFVELCAGTAALSLRLQGGNRCRPVVSRMGAKTGYANVILACFGLTPGGKAGAYLWCEPDPGARLLLQALPQPDVLREAASVLRGWASEDPRTLWEALRKEGPPKGCDGREVARYALSSAWTGSMGAAYCGPDRPSSVHPPGWVASITAQGVADRCAALPPLPPTTITEDARTVDPREVARLLLTGVWSYKQGMPESGFIGPGQRRQDTTATATATAQIADLCGGVNAEIVADARGVDPREVARQVWLQGRSFNHRGPDAGFTPSVSANGVPVWGARAADEFATDMDSLRSMWPPVAVTSDAREIDPPQLPEGTVVFCDPPYFQTTGYRDDLPRSEVVRMARLWADAGAFVGVSEQVPIPELMADGWHAVRITNGRKGQARTFSKQKDEWLTLSRPPVNPPLLGVQEGLF